MIWRFQSQSMRSWRLVLLCLLIPFSGNVHAANGEDELKRINAIKAAFVLNIARFVTWPSEVFSSANDPMRLCVYRDNVYRQHLEAIKDKKIGRRNVELSTIEHLQPKLDCQILLIPQSASGKFHVELGGKLQQPLLTIVDRTGTNEEGISRDGVIVTLVRQGSRIGFEIDPWQAKRANLHMSSELLKLATIVGKGQ